MCDHRSWLAGAMVLLVGVCIAAEPEPKPRLKLSKEEQLLVDLTNQARAKKHLPALKPNPILFKVARAHAANMAKLGEMKHTLNGKNPQQRIEAAGYDYGWSGENIAVSFGGVRPKPIFTGWMNSKIHHDNILRPQFTEIGIGIASNDKGDYYYAQEFGSPRER